MEQLKKSRFRRFGHFISKEICEPSLKLPIKYTRDQREPDRWHASVPTVSSLKLPETVSIHMFHTSLESIVNLNESMSQRSIPLIYFRQNSFCHFFPHLDLNPNLGSFAGRTPLPLPWQSKPARPKFAIRKPARGTAALSTSRLVLRPGSFLHGGGAGGERRPWRPWRRQLSHAR